MKMNFAMQRLLGVIFAGVLLTGADRMKSSHWAPC